MNQYGNGQKFAVERSESSVPTFSEVRADGIATAMISILKDSSPVTNEPAHTGSATVADPQRRIAELEARVTQLEALSTTDIVTSALNRRGFHEHLERILAHSRRHGVVGALLLCDIDDFKAINDAYGHEAGDAVLRNLAQLFRSHTRETDVTARIGGDEFAVLLTHSDWTKGRRRAEALDHLVNSSGTSWNGRHIPFRASFGIEPYGPHDNALHLLRKADMSMYARKRARSGRPKMACQPEAPQSAPQYDHPQPARPFGQVKALPDTKTVALFQGLCP